MNRRPIIPLLALCVALTQARAADQNPLTRLFDTGGASAQPLTGAVVTAQSGWTLVPEDTTNHAFSGDAVLMNDKLVLVLRRHGTGAEIYARTAAGATERAGVDASRAQPGDAIKIVENSSGGVVLGRGPARFKLTAGESIVELRSADPAGFFNVRSSTRYVVVPDYFADDMVFAPETNQNVCLPAENFCLNLIEGGDSMLMTVWQSSRQQVWLGERRSKSQPGTCALRITYLPGNSVWLAFLETPGIWTSETWDTDVKFKPPFPAKWRCSLTTSGNQAQSWDLQRQFRRMPANMKGHPLLIYAIDRGIETPLTVTCPTDITRNTLGVGPCQYILACEGLAAQGDPTPNAVMNYVEGQFEKKRQRKAADDIKERLAVMVEHVKQARARMDRYAAFAKETRQTIGDGPGAAPYQLILDDMDRSLAAGKTTDASPERAAELAKDVEFLLDDETALSTCQTLGAKLRQLGSIQDGTMARCRMAVRRLRQQAVTLTANEPHNPGPAAAVQRLAGQFLTNK